MRAVNAAFFVAMLLFVSELRGSAHAYLDPGTGSMALQLMLGGIVGALAFIKLYWRKVKSVIFRRRPEGDSPAVD